MWDKNINRRLNQTFVRFSLQSKNKNPLCTNRITLSHTNALKICRQEYQTTSMNSPVGYWISTQLCPDAFRCHMLGLCVFLMQICPLQQKLLCKPKIYCLVGKLAVEYLQIYMRPSCHIKRLKMQFLDSYNVAMSLLLFQKPANSFFLCNLWN